MTDSQGANALQAAASLVEWTFGLKSRIVMRTRIPPKHKVPLESWVLWFTTRGASSKPQGTENYILSPSPCSKQLWLVESGLKARLFPVPPQANVPYVAHTPPGDPPALLQALPSKWQGTRQKDHLNRALLPHSLLILFSSQEGDCLVQSILPL